MVRTAGIRMALMVLAAAAAPVAADDPGAPRPPALPEIMPEALETELALSALPEHLRAESAVFLYRRGGYRLSREGSNGFAALVRRVGVTPFPFEGSLIPEGYDAEGVRTHLPRILEETRLLESGLGFDEVEARIARGFREGRFQAPARPGVTYMLSAANIVPFGEPGNNAQYVPHYMFYAPNLDNADVGGPREIDLFASELFKVRRDAGPHSFMFLPVGEDERRRIFLQQQDLLERVGPFHRGRLLGPERTGLDGGNPGDGPP